MGARLWRYYSSKMSHAYQIMHPRETNWEQSAASLKGGIAKFGASLDLPFKSLAIFVGSWLILEIGWSLILVFGVATAGTVWKIPATIVFLFITIYGTVLTSGTNMVRTLIMQLGDRRDNLVKALFRGYLWSLLSVGVVYLVHDYFHKKLAWMFILPILYFVPMQVLGTTVPVPIFLGISGWYMDIMVVIIAYAVGVTGACIGGIEILRYLLNASSQHGSYGAIFGLLLLSIFPVMNVYFTFLFFDGLMDIMVELMSFA
jgi:hypothetical protein